MSPLSPIEQIEVWLELGSKRSLHVTSRMALPPDVTTFQVDLCIGSTTVAFSEPAGSLTDALGRIVEQLAAEAALFTRAIERGSERAARAERTLARPIKPEK
jgi:hypothetical protein